MGGPVWVLEAVGLRTGISRLLRLLRFEKLGLKDWDFEAVRVREVGA